MDCRGRLWTETEPTPAAPRPDGPPWTPVDAVWRSTDQEVGFVEEGSGTGIRIARPGRNVRVLHSAPFG